MNFVDYIKNNYKLYLTLITILLIGLLLVISFLKKRKKKKDLNLQVTSEDNENLQIYKNCYVIYRKNIQEYVLALYDEFGKILLYSEPQISLLQCKNMLPKIINAINNTQIWITKDLNGMVLGIYSFNDKQIALTCAYNNLDEFEKNYSKYQKLCNSELNKDVIKYNGIIDFNSEVVFNKHNKHNWKFDDINNYYSYKLYSIHNDLLLTTFEMFNKKNSKKEFKEVLESIKEKRFVIEFNPFTKMYKYVLRNKNNETIAYSNEYETVVEVKKLIEEIIIQA